MQPQTPGSFIIAQAYQGGSFLCQYHTSFRGRFSTNIKQFMSLCYIIIYDKLIKLA